MPTRTRPGPQPRGGPRARAATARRRVRTTSNANNVGAMARYRRHYRATKTAGHKIGRMHRRMRRMSVGGALWALLTLIIAIVAVVAESAGTAAAAGISLGVTVGVEKYQRRKGRSGVPAPPRKQSTPRGKAPAPPKGGTAGTGGSGGPRPGVCGEACKRSKRPKNTCKCTAPSCEHGSLAGAAKP